jgi:hypothetical protein
LVTDFNEFTDVPAIFFTIINFILLPSHSYDGADAIERQVEMVFRATAVERVLQLVDVSNACASSVVARVVAHAVDIVTVIDDRVSARLKHVHVVALMFAFVVSATVVMNNVHARLRVAVHAKRVRCYAIAKAVKVHLVQRFKDAHSFRWCGEMCVVVVVVVVRL